MSDYMSAQMDSQIEGAISENEQLRRENEALRKDAERWRFASTSRNFGITFWSEHGQCTCYDALAAQRVDAAMELHNAV